MPVITFGNFAVDMTHPTFLTNALSSSISSVSGSSSHVNAYLSNGTRIDLTGFFDLSSESALLSNSFLSGGSIYGSGGTFLAGISGLPQISFAEVLSLNLAQLQDLAANTALTIVGSSFNDHLIGAAGPDHLVGNGGNDLLAA